MNSPAPNHNPLRPLLAILVVAGGLIMTLAPNPARPDETSPKDPWSSREVMQPEELAQKLSSADGKKPLVVCVGFEFLYKGAHIPGALFVGPGREPRGIEALKKWARGVEHGREVVIYCGCCPMKECPNMRPAYEALRRQGMAHLKVLYLENNFARDWVDKGFAAEKGGGE